MNIPQREEGQGLVEYALILVLVAIVVIIILSLLGTQIVFAFARVAGGLRGDVLDAANGDTAVLVNYEANITGSGGSCAGTLTAAQFVVTDSSGQVLTSQSVMATLMVNGVSTATLNGTANNNGLASSSGILNISGTCPLQLTLE